MNTESLYYIEILLIIGVIIFQIGHTVKVRINISKLKNIFSSKLSVRNGFIEKEKIGKVNFNQAEIYYEDKIDLNEESFADIAGDDILKISLIDTKGKNEIISQIKLSINTYLLNNFGAVVNFNIIKDIVDREIEVKDEEISQSVTLPLYLGLAATMIGIICGLLFMPELNGDGFSEGVNTLIGSVKFAMIGSLSGLVCTTYLSSFAYKKAKRIVQKDKNEQLTYLQAELLPELIKAEDSGLSGLKASLDKFARVVTKISNNVLIAANQTGENLLLQKEVIERVDNMNVHKISKLNVELFEKLDNNMDAFNKFSTYLNSMERISSQLSEFSGRTSDINKIFDSIDSTLGESRVLTKFLTSHFEEIENYGNIARKSVGLAESHFTDSIEQLNKRTEEIISQLYKSAGDHEANLEKIYEGIERNLNDVTTKHIASFKEVYSESVPKFELLDNLSLLKEIKEDSIRNNQNITYGITELNNSVNSLKPVIDEQKIIVKNNDIINERKTSNRKKAPKVLKKQDGNFDVVENSSNKTINIFDISAIFRRWKK